VARNFIQVLIEGDASPRIGLCFAWLPPQNLPASCVDALRLSSKRAFHDSNLNVAKTVHEKSSLKGVGHFELPFVAFGLIACKVGDLIYCKAERPF